MRYRGDFCKIFRFPAPSTKAVPLRAISYPNDGNVESAIAARGAGGQFASQHMLARFMRATRTSSVCRAQHLLRRAYPNDGIVEPVSPARGAESHFARKQMLSRAVREGQGRWVNMGLRPIPFFILGFRD